MKDGGHPLNDGCYMPGPGFGKGGTGVMSVDGKEVARQQITHTIPLIMTLDETFDIGSDTRTGVENGDSEGFVYSG